MKKIALLLALLLAGCAQYSACVRAAATAAFKTDTAASIEQQVSSVLGVTASAGWIYGGLTAIEDACRDVSCQALVTCVVQAWQQAHPVSAVTAAAHQGASAFRAKHSASASLDCHRAVASAR